MRQCESTAEGWRSSSSSEVEAKQRAAEENTTRHAALLQYVLVTAPSAFHSSGRHSAVGDSLISHSSSYAPSPSSSLTEPRLTFARCNALSRSHCKLRLPSGSLSASHVHPHPVSRSRSTHSHPAMPTENQNRLEQEVSHRRFRSQWRPAAACHQPAFVFARLYQYHALPGPAWVTASIACRSALTLARPDDVAFPPRRYCDFVIHYDDTAFLVHKLTLHTHSAYFRALFLMLPPTTTPSDRSPDCSHPHTVHCVHIPTQKQSVRNLPVTASSFRLFLCHLYFPAHYRYPPYLPHDDVDLSDELAPLVLALDYPPLEKAELSVLPASGQGGGGKLREVRKGIAFFNESILALAHYFDCPRLLQRCEEMGILSIGGQASNACSDLRYAHHYKMQPWKQHCLQITVVDKRTS